MDPLLMVASVERILESVWGVKRCSFPNFDSSISSGGHVACAMFPLEALHGMHA